MKIVIALFIFLSSLFSRANTCVDYLNQIETASTYKSLKIQYTSLKDLSLEQKKMLEDLATLELETRKLADPNLRRSNFSKLSQDLQKLNLSGIGLHIYYEVLSLISEKSLIQDQSAKQNIEEQSIELEKTKKDAIEFESHILRTYSSTKDLTEALFLFFSFYETGGKENIDVIFDNAFLIARINVDSTNLKGKTFLHLVAEHGHLKAIRELLKRQSNIDSRDSEGMTPVHLAITHKKFEAASILLDAGADKELKNFREDSPLFSSVASSPEILELLLLHKADMYAPNRNGTTAFQQAISLWKDKEIRIFLNHGYNPETVDANGRTHLHHAALEHSPEIIQILLAQKVNVNARDNDNKTPLGLLIEEHKKVPHSDFHDSLKQILIDHGGIE